MNRTGRPTPVRAPALPLFIRLGKGLRESVLRTMAYVAQATGTEPTQEEIAAALRSGLEPHQKVVMLPGAGHWTQQERPKEVNEALIAFLKGL